MNIYFRNNWSVQLMCHGWRGFNELKALTCWRLSTCKATNLKIVFYSIKKNYFYPELDIPLRKFMMHSGQKTCFLTKTNKIVIHYRMHLRNNRITKSVFTCIFIYRNTKFRTVFFIAVDEFKHVKREQHPWHI